MDPSARTSETVMTVIHEKTTALNSFSKLVSK